MIDRFDPASSASPPGWDREVPMYRASRDLVLSEKTRIRFELPFTRMADHNCRQYAHKPIAKGEIIETKAWPHESFIPLNCSAWRVLAFFNAQPKSRLPRSPFRGDRIVLDPGGGPAQPNISRYSGVTPA
jgi:hypothetical protein